MWNSGTLLWLGLGLDSTVVDEGQTLREFIPTDIKSEPKRSKYIIWGI